MKHFQISQLLKQLSIAAEQGKITPEQLRRFSALVDEAHLRINNARDTYKYKLMRENQKLLDRMKLEQENILSELQQEKERIINGA